jgi:hypothetical protein
MKEDDTNDIQRETNTAHDHNEHWILHIWMKLVRFHNNLGARTLQ